MPSGIPLGCPRPDCPDYGERRQESVRVYHRYGTGGWILYRCLSCRRTFSERQWTPFFRLQIPETHAVQILRLVGTGTSIRAAAQEVGVDKNTVLRIVGLGAKHVRWFQASMPPEWGWTAGTGEQVATFLREKARQRVARSLKRRPGVST